VSGADRAHATLAAVEALGANAPELASYQDEPPQMASGTVGKSGYLRLGFERRGTKTILVDLERRTPFLVQRALYWDRALPDMPCVFIITTSGCVLQGDRLALDIALAPGARAHVTTQSAMKIHSMDANCAAQTQSIRLGDDSYLEYLPDAVIPHHGARFASDTTIEIAPNATLLYAETMLCGRKHHRPSEHFGFDVLSSRIAAARPGGAPLWTEKYVIEPARSALTAAGVMGDFDVFGNVLLLTPKVHADTIHAALQPVHDRPAGIAIGASRLPNDAGLLVRVLGRESQSVKDAIRTFWSLARRTVLGVDIPPEFLWR